MVAGWMENERSSCFHTMHMSWCWGTFFQVFNLSLSTNRTTLNCLGYLSLLLVELQRQFLALRRAGALPLQAWLERRGLGSCALPTHRELPFVYNWGVLRTPLFYQIKSLCNCTSAAPEPLVPQSKRSTLLVVNVRFVLSDLDPDFMRFFKFGPTKRHIGSPCAPKAS